MKLRDHFQASFLSQAIGRPSEELDDQAFAILAGCVIQPSVP